MTPVGSDWQMDPPPETGDGPFPALKRFESTGVHVQATAQMAADRAWYYRRAWYRQLEPDTRRCAHCGEITFPALDLTDEERQIRHPLSTNVLTNRPADPF